VKQQENIPQQFELRDEFEQTKNIPQQFELRDEFEQTPNQEKPKLCKVNDPECEACQ
jgi:hypothetical protein